MKDKEEFIKEMLAAAKKNLEKDGSLMQMLFLDTDKGLIANGLLGVSSKENLRGALAQIGRQYAKKGTKIHTVFLLSDATTRKFPMEMGDTILEGKLPKEVLFKSAMETTDSIIMAEWDLTNDYQATTVQQYHKEDKKIIFDGKPIKLEHAVVNMLDPFVQNYKIRPKENKV